MGEPKPKAYGLHPREGEALRNLLPRAGRPVCLSMYDGSRVAVKESPSLLTWALSPGRSASHIAGEGRGGNSCPVSVARLRCRA